jgi:ankyrin repeat protein
VLHLASSERHEGVAWLLIDKGADVSATDNDRKTLLQGAWNKGVAQLLIDKGTDISATDKEGETLLYLALS